MSVRCIVSEDWSPEVLPTLPMIGAALAGAVIVAAACVWVARRWLS